MNMDNLLKTKHLMISMGVYRPLRYIYDRVIRPERAARARQEMALYSQFVGQDDLCFDIGANLGRKTAALLRLGARVVAVEPQPDCLREIRALLGNNPRLSCVPKAVGHEPGVAPLYVSKEHALSSLHSDWFTEHSGKIDVEVTTLDALIDEFGLPVFCKIDVEGHEVEVLSGLTRSIRALSFEYNLRSPDKALQCLEVLRRNAHLRCNMTRMEDLCLIWDEWSDAADFESRFRDELRLHPECWGGDIFVRCD